MAEYLLDNFFGTAFDEADTGRNLDERIQNLNFREDTILGDAPGSIIEGTDRRDRLVGTDADDVILGEAGNDNLLGGDGADTLRGGLGRDRLVGGADSDIFVLAPGEGTDRIQDFEVGVDVIGLADGITFDDLTFERKSILIDGERLATFNRGVDPRSFTADDFVIA